MTSLLVVCCFSLLLAGVSGADDVTVSVMKGGSITLPINPGEIKERLQWKYNNSDIASFNLQDKDIPAVYSYKRFTNRLIVDPQTGSLTIKNIRTEDTGEYQLEIRDKTPNFNIFKTFSVTVNDQEITVYVMKGNHFTLHTGVKIQPDKVKWAFNGTDLMGFEHTDVNQQTGEVNIRPDKSGKYDVQINSRNFILQRTFRVNINDEVKSVSGVEEETVTLDTKIPTQSDDVIEWKFKNTRLAKVDRTEHPYNYQVSNKRWDVNLQGSLIIKDLKTDDSGTYDVHITNSKHIIQKRFSLTVTGSSSRSHQVMIGPGLFVLVIMSVIVLV